MTYSVMSYVNGTVLHTHTHIVDQFWQTINSVLTVVAIFIIIHSVYFTVISPDVANITL